MNQQQKNIMLMLFLSQQGIGNLAEDYAKDNHIDNHSDIINEFEIMQKNIFDHIWDIAETDKQLLPLEIEQICASYCFKYYQWINEVGFKALKNWLMWMCWHEGILKKS